MADRTVPVEQDQRTPDTPPPPATADDASGPTERADGEPGIEIEALVGEADATADGDAPGPPHAAPLGEDRDDTRLPGRTPPSDGRHAPPIASDAESAGETDLLGDPIGDVGALPARKRARRRIGKGEAARRALARWNALAAAANERLGCRHYPIAARPTPRVEKHLLEAIEASPECLSRATPEAWVEAVFAGVEASPFLQGEDAPNDVERRSRRDLRTLDWATKRRGRDGEFFAVRVLDGAYGGPGAGAQGSTAPLSWDGATRRSVADWLCGELPEADHGDLRTMLEHYTRAEGTVIDESGRARVTVTVLSGEGIDDVTGPLIQRFGPVLRAANSVMRRLIFNVPADQPAVSSEE